MAISQNAFPGYDPYYKYRRFKDGLVGENCIFPENLLSLVSQCLGIPVESRVTTGVSKSGCGHPYGVDMSGICKHMKPGIILCVTWKSWKHKGFIIIQDRISI